MEVVVFGAGSLGSLLGGLLAHAHDVTLVGRHPHVSAVRDSGLRVTGIEEFGVEPRATADGTGLDADLALVTVKAFDTEAAARDLATGRFEAVLSMQNGMGNEEVLADRIDAPVLAGTTTHGAILREPGVVEWTGRGEVVIGAWRPPETTLAGSAGGAFRAAGVEATVVDDVRRRLWEKLAVNAAINPVTALARVHNGALASGPTNGVARAAARETARVARAEGIDLDDATAVARAEAVAETTATNRSSMYGDVAAGRRTEIDVISGHVVARGDEHGIPVPTNRALCGLVRGWEADRGLR